IVSGGIVVVLLQWKRPLHEGVERIEKTDLRAVMRLALIGLIVLPLMPDVSYGPYGVVNPFDIWLIVVLVCGISLGAYLAERFLGGGTGVLVSGILGGLISSTATSVSHARFSRRSPAAAGSSAAIIAIASTVVFVRIFAEVAVVQPQLVLPMAPQLGAMTALMAIVSAWLFWRGAHVAARVDVSGDPLELRSAVAFGLLYVLVLLGVAAVREHFGEGALYTVAAISGLTDVDAITLSTAQMIGESRIDLDTGWRMIVIGAIANLGFKAGIVATLGDRRMKHLVGIGFGVAIAGGLALVLLWPSTGS
ncbi:MAG: DUF4010 domain-containing protein, partial [Planctomycetes bacterium]|nr:DUF4010 domain-containing protein [Planctomycetota bacterium]